MLKLVWYTAGDKQLKVRTWVGPLPWECQGGKRAKHLVLLFITRSLLLCLLHKWWSFCCMKACGSSVKEWLLCTSVFVILLECKLTVTSVYLQALSHVVGPQPVQQMVWFRQWQTEGRGQPPGRTTSTPMKQVWSWPYIFLSLFCWNMCIYSHIPLQYPVCIYGVYLVCWIHSATKSTCLCTMICFCKFEYHDTCLYSVFVMSCFCRFNIIMRCL